MARLLILILFTVLALLLAPATALAQDGDGGGVAEPVVVSVGGAPDATDVVSPTASVQITASSPELIGALLDTTPAIAGGFSSYFGAVLWTFLFGALGGLVYEMLRLQGNIEWPHWYRANQEQSEDTEYRPTSYGAADKLFDLGTLARMFVGGMAGIAILLVLTPPDRVKLTAAAVIAGSAGATIFDILRTRLLATLAAADAADMRAKAKLLDEKMAEMDALLAKLKEQNQDQVELVATASGGTRDLKKPEVQAAEANIRSTAATLSELDRTLAEAKGIRETMDRRPAVRSGIATEVAP